MTVLLAIWLISSHIVIKPAQKQEAQQTTTIDQNDTAGKVEPPNPVPPATAAEKETADDHSLADKKARDLHDAIAPPTWSNWALVIVGTGGIIAAIITLCSIKRQTRSIHHQAIQVRKQSHIMRRQMNLAIQKERPRISIKPGQLFFNPGETTKISYAIDCYCPSPAFITDSGIEVFAVAKLTVKPFPFKIDVPKQIVKSEEIWKHAFVFAGAHPETVNQLDVRAKNITIRMRGFIKYTGIHLGEKDAPYTTTFAYDWVPIEVRNSPDYGYWRENGENKQT